VLSLAAATDLASSMAPFTCTDSGGDGQHDGQRDDSIGLARCVTHGYAGLRQTHTGSAEATAGATATSNAHVIRTAELSSSIGNGQHWEVLASLGGGGAGDVSSSSLRVRSITMSGSTADTRSAETSFGELIDLTAELHGGNPALSRASIRPLWAKFSTGNRSRLALEFHCVGDCTLFALRKTARLQQAVN
jgi:hypothetical protein